MSYLDGLFISREMDEIEFLQQKVIQQSFFADQSFDQENTIEYLHTLYALLEKQHTVYFRLTLTDDPAAIELKERLEEAAELMGMPDGMTVNEFYMDMKEEVKAELRDLTGEEID